MKILATNKRGRFDYEITEKLIAGIELTGAEVKSIKAGHISLKGSFVAFRGIEGYLTNAHVSPYKYAALAAEDEPTRSRRLLMHKKELERLSGLKTQGLSVIPLAVGLQRNLIKIELGIGRGKKMYDKRATMQKRDVERDMARKLSR